MPLSQYDYITIDGTQINRPREFKPKRVDVYAGEYTTCTGKVIADRIGWKYDDLTLSWEALSEDKVLALASMTGQATFAFDDVDGAKSETVIRTSAVQMRHRDTIGGVTYWRDVSVEVTFINVHND